MMEALDLLPKRIVEQTNLKPTEVNSGVVGLLIDVCRQPKQLAMVPKGALILKNDSCCGSRLAQKGSLELQEEIQLEVVPAFRKALGEFRPAGFVCVSGKAAIPGLFVPAGKPVPSQPREGWDHDPESGQPIGYDGHYVTLFRGDLFGRALAARRPLAQLKAPR